MQDVKQTQFAQDLKKSNICSKLFFIYPRKIIRLAKENEYNLTDEMIINMNTEKVE